MAAVLAASEVDEALRTSWRNDCGRRANARPSCETMMEEEVQRAFERCCEVLWTIAMDYNCAECRSAVTKSLDSPFDSRRSGTLGPRWEGTKTGRTTVDFDDENDHNYLDFMSI